MSPHNFNIDPAVLLVSDSNDADVGLCADRLDAAGIRVRRATSVYAAAADLATDNHIRCVLLDIRSLDDKEMGFHRLIRRSFQDTNLIVPIFSGTEDRAATYGPGIRPTPLEAAISGLIEEYGRKVTAVDEPAAATPAPTEELPIVPDAETPDFVDVEDEADDAFEDSVEDATSGESTFATEEPEPSEEGTPANELEESGEFSSETGYEEEPLATDAEGELPSEPADASTSFAPEPESPAAEPTAYDAPADPAAAEESSREAYQAVRDRLAAELRSSTQRTPPRRRPPGAPEEPDNAASPQNPDRPTSMLSPEEMDALMTNQDDEFNERKHEGGDA